MDIDFGTIKFFDKSVATGDNIKKLELSMSSLDLTVPSEMDKSTKELGFLEAIPTTSTGISHRSLRTRKPTTYHDDKLRSTRGRAIERIRKSSTFTNATITKEDIKKIYLNNKVGKMKVTLLETIFEENLPNSNVSNGNFNLFGRKLKRSLSCSDGTNITKTLKDKRKKRAKKINALRLGRISMDTFKNRLRLMHRCEEDDDDLDDIDLIPIESSSRPFELRRSMSDSSTSFHSNAAQCPSDDDEDDST